MNPLPIPDEAELWTIAGFRAAVLDGVFNEYDGTGYYGTERGYDSDYPVDITGLANGAYPVEYTHVIWFAK